MRWVVIVLLAAVCPDVTWGSAHSAAGSSYLEVVQAYADAMLLQGRDVYGATHSPLFASALDRESLRIPAELPAIEGIRKTDRSYSGGNPMHDENLYLLLYDLAELTGDLRYKNEADAALKFFLSHAQSPVTGLLAWGEHLHWDFEREAMGGNDIHEFYRPWVLFGPSYRLVPNAMVAYARGLWDHQIADQAQGHYSRHATWSKHFPHAGFEFPRHGGFYIAQWAEASRRTRDPVFQEAIDSLLEYYERVRHPETLALPNRNPASGTAVCWTLSQVSLAVDLGDAWMKVPEPLSSRMRETARRNDAGFLPLPHDFTHPSKGIVSEAEFNAVAGQLACKHCPTWASGYGITTNAQAAMTCYERYLQTRDPGYRDLVLQTARLYLHSEPDQSIELYPGALGDAIFLMIAAHRITAAPDYLQRANHLARQAIPLFWDKGPLPRASSRTTHYETITRADTLARSLLVLYGEMNNHHLPTSYIDR
jgi:hypothetical protein